MKKSVLYDILLINVKELTEFLPDIHMAHMKTGFIGRIGISAIKRFEGNSFVFSWGLVCAFPTEGVSRSKLVHELTWISIELVLQVPHIPYYAIVDVR
jgi:hypothetical protein